MSSIKKTAAARGWSVAPHMNGICLMTPIRIDELIQLAVQALNCSYRTSYVQPGIKLSQSLRNGISECDSLRGYSDRLRREEKGE